MARGATEYRPQGRRASHVELRKVEEEDGASKG